MTGSMLTALALLAAVASALWSGLFVLAEEAPTVARVHGEQSFPRGAVPLYRAVQLSRLALLITASVCASFALSWWRRPALEAAGTVFLTTVFLYVIADAMPRALGVLAPRVAGAAAPVARRSLGPFRPLLALVTNIEQRITALLPPPASRPTEPFGPGQRDMLLGLFSLRDMTVADIMTPRLDIVAADAHFGIRDLIELLRRSEHARLPVYHEDLDKIIGILYAKDLTPATAGIAPLPTNWQELVRPAQFVPESKTLAAQLRDFQRGPSHLAIVVDEFGGTSGLITLEDVLEEVVGEIYDEYDIDEEPSVEREGDDRFWVDGRVTIDELSELLGMSVDHEDVATVGGLIYSELGRVPRPGEELRLGEFRVVVEQVVRRRVRRVYFERLHDTSAVEVQPEAER